ncbi:lipopolysaccharide biosynthesis protein [Tenacibaculum sp. KUL152]|nr:lipopolysaccharide biosynthesis protein [Tenacibaculum sp. KUL152]
MREVVLNSLKWVAIGKAIGQTVRWLTTIFTIRFLFPEDYAVIALSSFFTSLLWSFSRSGISAALIREKELDDRTLSEFFTFTIVAHVSLFLILQLSASVLADFYGDERLEDVIRFTSIAFLIALIGFIPGTLLNRNMKFKKLSMVDATAESISALTTVTLAWAGFGFWSIIIGMLLAESLRQCGYLLKNTVWVMPRWFTSKTKSIFEFSWKASLQSTVGYMIFNIDVAIAGIYLSTIELGYYQFAVMLAMMPAAKVLPLLRQVAFPVYSNIQEDSKAIERYFLKSLRLSALLFVPVFFGLAAVSDTLTSTFFGDKWSGAITVLFIYCLSMPLKGIEQLFGPLLKSLNKMNVIIGNTAIFGAVLIPSFFIGAQFGGEGLAIAWLVSFSCCFFINASRSCNALGIKFSSVVLLLVKPYLLGSTMLAVCVLLGKSLDNVVSVWIVLAAQVTIGALLYFGLTWLFSRNELKELINLFRRN